MKPHIEFEGKKYFVIGCSKCKKGGAIWNVGSDDNNFIMSCGNCKHTIIIDQKNIKDKPD